MAKYFYIAWDQSGKKISAFDEAGNEEELMTRLQQTGYTVVSITAAKDAVGQATSSSGINKSRNVRGHLGVSVIDLAMFARQLSILLASGVTILVSLDTISKQVSSIKLYNVIKKMQTAMEGGMSFHETLARHPEVFSGMWVNLVESGEASGNLPVVLDRLAMYLERQAEFQRKLVSSLIYPVILFLGALGALLFLTIKIVPTFAEVFKGFDIQLPAATLMLMNTSDFIRKYILMILICLGVAGFLFKQYISTKEGKRQWETFLFKLPIFGDFFRAMIIERFSAEMSTLVESGVPILYSLEIAEHSVGSVIMAETINHVREEVRAGKSLSKQLETSGFFDPMVIQMIGIGEEIGELSQMFKRVNAFYQQAVETFLTRILTMFEPFMLIFMGGVIGLMVVAMFLPIFQMAKVGS